MTREEALKSFEEENKDFEKIFERYGYQMSPEEVSAIKEAIERNKVAISALKGFKGMTNGGMIISLYPNLKYTIQNGRVVITIGVASSFDLDWWNAPYKGEIEG